MAAAVPGHPRESEAVVDDNRSTANQMAALQCETISSGHRTFYSELIFQDMGVDGNLSVIGMDRGAATDTAAAEAMTYRRELPIMKSESLSAQ